MYYDYEQYAKNAINKYFTDIQQKEVKDKYITTLHKLDHAIRDIEIKDLREDNQRLREKLYC